MPWPTVIITFEASNNHEVRINIMRNPGARTLAPFIPINITALSSEKISTESSKRIRARNIDTVIKPCAAGLFIALLKGT